MTPYKNTDVTTPSLPAGVIRGDQGNSAISLPRVLIVAKPSREFSELILHDTTILLCMSYKYVSHMTPQAFLTLIRAMSAQKRGQGVPDDAPDTSNPCKLPCCAIV
ncbi:jg26936 [Pararge aegeria aegeria]|uniref:Jg26936 protein n=1 Tax=Pararge aegeria aegeria TaxID=348720 RepID=A0A8S4QNT1_9NEOP|nr:jg26936 [Pararge aegeria aegeria]